MLVVPAGTVKGGGPQKGEHVNRCAAAHLGTAEGSAGTRGLQTAGDGEQAQRLALQVKKSRSAAQQ